MNRLFFDVFVGMPAEGVAWWCCFFKFGILIYVVFDSFGFADFFFVGSFATLKSVCGEVKRFEDGDERDYACMPCVENYWL